MSMPSRKQRSSLARDLKAFARTESPMFSDGHIDAMRIEQSYVLFDRMPEDIDLPGQLEIDETKIDLGFIATRRLRDDGKKPYYTFEVRLTGSRALHPRQLELSDDAWEMLSGQYVDDGLAGAIISADDLEDIEPLTDEQIRDEIIDGITDSGDTVESYQSVGYSYSTAEPSIESSYERGISVDGSRLDVFSSHGRSEFDDNREAVFPLGDEVLHIPPKYFEDELEIADEILVREQFIHIIRGTHLDTEANLNALIPHEDKLAEMMFLVECMRRRRIDIA